MANETGFTLIIDDKMLNKLDLADKKIEQLQKTSNKTSVAVISAFKQMSVGVDPLISKLNEANGILSKMKSPKMSFEGLKGMATDGEKAAKAVADISVALNKAKSSPIDDLNKKISSLKDLLVQSTKAAEDYANKMSSIKSTGSGTISGITIKEGNAGKSLIPQIQAEIDALEQEKKSLLSSQAMWIQRVETLNGSSLATQRQVSDMAKLNDAFRNGQSEMQKQAKAQDDLAKAAERTAKSVEKQAAAEAKKAAQSQAKGDNAATRAVEQYNNALNKSEVTIANRARKIEALANAERALTQTGRAYSTEINKIRTETERLNKANTDAANSTDKIKSSHRGLMDTSGQLARQLALVFSVSQIEGYIMKLVTVRGEFELQQKALQAILQNKDEADKLFGQITDLAVRSPFRVKELVTYTKELAAYRVETSKLYDTTKMLADVSAGLGVDMSRLILAFGQVKAANYLRGTELRQFSEAGINILGELATYFTELEGQMVSVGDVFERVSKRMVSFGDVEEIFKRITSAGGIFYNMQEIQAETLQGQISNLYDSFDLMFNEIGKANDGVLKGTVSLLRSMADNWQIIADTITPIITSFLVYKGIIFALIGYEKAMIALRALSNNQLSIQSSLLIKSKDGQTLFNKASKANPYLIIGGILISILMGVYNAIKASREEQEKFNKTVSEGVQSANELSANFKRLADAATDSNKSVKEQNEAFEELKRIYSDILPSQTLQIENLRAMKGNYDAVTSAIYAKIEAQTKEKISQEIQATYGKEAVNSTDKLISKLKDFNISTEKSRTILSEFRKKFDEGFINSPQKAQVAIEDLIKSYTGQTIKLTKGGFFEEDGVKTWGRIVIGEVANIYNSFASLRYEMSKIDDMSITPFQAYGGTVLFGQFEKQLNGISSSMEKWKQDNQNNFNPFELNEEAKSKTIAKYQDFINDLSSKLKSGKFKGNDIEIVNSAIQSAQKEIDSFNGTKIQQEVKRIFTTFADVNETPLDGMDKLFLGSEEGLVEYKKRLEDLLKDLEERVAVFNKNTFLSPFSSDQISQFAAQIPLVKNQIEKVNFEQVKANKTSNDALSILNERIGLIKESNKVYEKQLGYYDKETAKLKTIETLKNAFKEAGLGNMLDTMSFDDAGTIKSIESLMNKAGSKGRMALEKALIDFKGQIGIDVQIEKQDALKSQIEDLFSGYEMSIELGKLNIPPELMKQIFNVDTVSLDDVQKKIIGMKDEFANLGEPGVKSWNDALRKVADLNSKRIKEDAKTYTEYLLRSKDERIRIEEEVQRKIAEMRATKSFTKPQEEAIEKDIKKEAATKVAQLDYTDLKATDMYKQSFEDLERLGTTTLNIILSELEQFAEKSGQNLPITEFKELMNNIRGLREEVESRNPFQELVNSIKEYREALEEIPVAQANLKKATFDSDVANTQKEAAKEELVTAQAELDTAPEEQKAAALKKVQDAQLALTMATTYAVAADANKSKAADDVAKAENKKASALSKATKAIGKQKAAFDTMGNAINQALDMSKELAEGMGMSFSPETQAVVDSIGKAIGLVSAAMSVMNLITIITDMSAKSLMTTMLPLLAIALALAAVFAIVAIGDAKKEKQIKKEQDKVENLEKAYKKLEKAIAGAYELDTLSKSTDMASKNIDQQIASYNKMIKAEGDKKKTDDDKIKEWKNTIEDLREQQKQLRVDFYQTLGGFGDSEAMKSAAQDFTDAWYDAYKETGDGLTGLNEQFGEFIDNVVKKQIMLRGVGKMLEPLFQMVDRMFDKTSEGAEAVTKNELDKLKEYSDTLLPQLDQFMKDMMASLGVAGGAGAELSGLQRGIEGISESTAQALEALLSSMRFFVADSNTAIKNLYGLFSNENTPNPILAELKAQTALVRSIYDLFNGMTAINPVLGRRGLITVI